MEWFRLYSEIKDDPKMLALTDGEFRLWINLLAMASESSERGVIASCPLDGLAKSLHTSKQFLQKSLRKFESSFLNIVKVRDDGAIVITNFCKRQPASDSSTERVRKHRNEKTKRYETVTETLQEQECNALDKIREDKIREDNNPPISSLGEDAGEAPPEELSVSDDEERINYQTVLDEYNRLCVNMPRAEVLTNDRRQSIKARIKECKKLGGIEAVFQVFRYAGQSPHHNGENDKGWRADFDWLIGPKNFRKMLERARSGTKAAGAGNGQRAPTPRYRAFGEDMPEL